MALGGVGLGFIALWHSEGWHIVVGMLFLGAGLPMTFAAMAKIIVDVVRPSETAVATGMNTVMRTIGGVIGGQVVAALLAAETIRRTTIPAESAFIAAFWIGAGGALVGALLALLITPRPSRRRSAQRELLVEGADGLVGVGDAPHLPERRA
jgi:MFS family permease